MYLTLIKTIKKAHGSTAVCRCRCGRTVSMQFSQFRTGHKKTCGSSECNSAYLSEVRIGKPNLLNRGRASCNWVDRTGTKHFKLMFLRLVKGSRSKWVCKCDCGNETEVSVSNLSRTKGCRHCANRIDITGETRGLLTAESVEEGVVSGRSPLWTFRCRCGNTIQSTVREFRANWVRSCGCHDSTWGSWKAMMNRCYDKKDPRYRHYGGRGITVCRRWHSFNNFAIDMGERPKRHTLSRKRCEEGYSKANCHWEHITKNTADTCFGRPTRPGLSKGARQRY